MSHCCSHAMKLSSNNILRNCITKSYYQEPTNIKVTKRYQSIRIKEHAQCCIFFTHYPVSIKAIAHPVCSVHELNYTNITFTMNIKGKPKKRMSNIFMGFLLIVLRNMCSVVRFRSVCDFFDRLLSTKFM